MAGDTASARAHATAGLRRAGFWLGPALGLMIALLPAPDGLPRDGLVAAGLLAWMALWWASEAAPIAATSLLPLIILPVAGILTPAQAAAPYADPTVLLLLGGFIIAIGIEKWNLHRRIALSVLMVSGARLKLIVAAFMLATALISMWISNTATTLMMTPIALSVALAAGGGARLAAPLLLGVAYAASIGGMATPVGTPTNLIAIAWLEENAGRAISFAEWMTFGLPVMILILPCIWVILTLGMRTDMAAAARASEAIGTAWRGLGRISAPEARLAAVFALVAAAWILREPFTALTGMKGLSDMGIAIAGAVLMFLIPSGAPGKGGALLDWEDARAIPWEVVLLFGGGLSVAAAIQTSGLADWLGQAFAGFAGVPMVVMLLVLVALIVVLSEFMSNVAAVTTFLPVLGALALASGMDILALAVPAALAASCGFMLPIATGPNAVVFGTREVTAGQMARAGFSLDIICVLIIAAWFGAGPAQF